MSRHGGYELHDPIGFEAGPPDRQSAHVDGLMRAFNESTALQPSADLSSRIRVRIAQEAPSTAPGRLLSALRALDTHGIWRGVVQSARTVVDPGTRSVVLRLQALTLVILVVGTSALGSAAAVAATAHVVAEVRDHVVGRPAIDSPSDLLDATRSFSGRWVGAASVGSSATRGVPAQRGAGPNEPAKAVKVVQPPAAAVDVPNGPKQNGKADPPGRSGDRPDRKPDRDAPAGQKAKGKGKGLTDQPGRSGSKPVRVPNEDAPAPRDDQARSRSGPANQSASASGGGTSANRPADPNKGPNGQGRSEPPGRSGAQSSDRTGGDHGPGPRRNGKSAA
jgi:hypothetical protein